MGYVKGILQPGEWIIYSGGKHWITYKRAIFCGLLWACFLAIANIQPASEFIHSDYRFNILYIILMIAILSISIFLFIYTMIINNTTEIVITNFRIIYKEGVIKRDQFVVPRSSLQMPHVKPQSPIETFLEYGTIILTGSGGASRTIDNVSNPIKFQNLATTPPPVAPPAEPSPPAHYTAKHAELCKAAEGGNERARWELAEKFQTGDGVPLDIDKAIFWYKKAAESKPTLHTQDTQWKLAEKFRTGDGIPANINEAAYWYRKIVDPNSHSNVNPEWKFRVGSLFAKGLVPCDDPNERDRLLSEAYSKFMEWNNDEECDIDPSAQHDAGAALHLGIMYRDGIYVKQDKVKAAELFGQIAKEDHSDSDRKFRKCQIAYGIMLRNGDGIPQNILQGTRWIYTGLYKGLFSGYLHEQLREFPELANSAPELFIFIKLLKMIS